MTRVEQAAIPGTQVLAAERRVVRCAGCGRELTDPEARMYGRGAGCREHMAVTPRGWAIEQESLPGV
jgi:hypothetical protein